MAEKVEVIKMPSTDPMTVGNVGMKDASNTQINPAKEDGNLASIKTNTDKIPASPAQESGNLATVKTNTDQLGAATDAEATGNGTITAILKRIRTLLGGTLTVAGTITANIGTVATLALESTQIAIRDRLPSALVGGRLDVNVGNAPTVAVSSLPALPAGTNNIGDVDVLTLPALPTGTNNIGDVDVLSLPALPTGNNNIGDVDIVSHPAITDKSSNANNNVVGNVSLGNSQGKTNVLVTGALTTTATTANQIILTYTVTAGKTFYLEYFDVIARLTTYAVTATLFGAVSLETPSGTKVYTTDMFHAGAAQPARIQFAEPIPIAAGTVIRLVCTPSATTSFAWKGNFGGFEK